MTLRLIGAGVGRTGTVSLKLAIERLTGGRCYHMLEALKRPDDFGVWRKAIAGEMPDWPAFISPFVATVDFPAACFWQELMDAFPDAKVLLSTRRDATTWYESASRTIFASRDGSPTGTGPLEGDIAVMGQELMAARFTSETNDRDAVIAAYERHNAAVRAGVPADRLVEWQPGDGWQPLADALGVAAPDEPFPHTNTTEDFRRFTGLA